MSPSPENDASTLAIQLLAIAKTMPAGAYRTLYRAAVHIAGADLSEVAPHVMPWSTAKSPSPQEETSPMLTQHETELRLRCVKLAVEAGAPHPIELAQRIHAFATGQDEKTPREQVLEAINGDFRRLEEERELARG